MGNVPLCALDKKQLENHKAAIIRKRDALMMNLSAYEQHLHTGSAFHPSMVKHTVEELRLELDHINEEYKYILGLQKKHQRYVSMKKWKSNFTRLFGCA